MWNPEDPAAANCQPRGHKIHVASKTSIQKALPKARARCLSDHYVSVAQILCASGSVPSTLIGDITRLSCPLMSIWF